MKSTVLQSTLVNWSVIHSGHDDRRPYIGLSGIADCERVIYERYMHGVSATITEKLKIRLAYDLEAVIIERIKSVGIFVPGKEISLHDGLVKGHTDGFIALPRDGLDLLEIKTLEQEAWIPRPPRLPNRIFFQVQAYLHYLELRHAHVVYLARDTGAIRVIGATHNPTIARRIDHKIASLVHAVRNYEVPDCSCGKCENRGSNGH